MDAVGIYRNDEKFADKAYEKLMKNPKLSAQNKRYLERYFSELRQEKSKKTLMRHVYSLKRLFDAVGLGKDFKKYTEADFRKAVDKQNNDGLSPEGKDHLYVTWRYFYKWLEGRSEQYPKKVQFLKKISIKLRKERAKLKPESLLTEEEVLKILAACTDVKQKSFISCLAESGARIGELLTIRKMDCLLNQTPAKLRISGKTGFREIPILSSKSILVEYLDFMKDLKEDDIIWRKTIPHEAEGSLSYAGACQMIRRLAKKAGIAKRVNPHSWRKARATFLSNSLSDQQLKSYSIDKSITLYTRFARWHAL